MVILHTKCSWQKGRLLIYIISQLMYVPNTAGEKELCILYY